MKGVDALYAEKGVDKVSFGGGQHQRGVCSGLFFDYSLID